MRFAPTADQLDLATVLRESLADAADTAAVLTDMGLLDLLADGGDESLLVTAMTEVGYAGVPAPAVATLAFAPGLLAAAGVARTGWVVADPQGSGVLDVAGRPALLLVGGFDGHGPVRIFDLSRLAPGAFTEIGSVDPRAALRRGPAAEDVTSEALLAVVDDPAVVALAWCRGVVAAAAELVGLARRMLDLTTAYVGQRRQFGVPVGSFQAIKHHLADVALAVEFAAPVVASAAAMLAGYAESLPEGSSARARRQTSGELTEAELILAEVSAAKVLASDAALLAARTAIQCHGAIGYTTEYDLHLYAKRAWALAASWGSADHHRSAVAKRLGLPTVTER